jgi:hypothetical protein
MNLVDLADEELIEIFQRMDHKTKLNLMLTCKRFENVIGSYLELFGKFKLDIKKGHLESPDRVQTLTQMRRHFGAVDLIKRDLNLDTKAYNLCFQLLTKIGSGVVELHICDSLFCFTSLINLLKLTPNISKLEMIRTGITPRADFNAQIKLEKLRNFKFEDSSNIEVFEKILKPNSLSEIKIIRPEVMTTRHCGISADYWTAIPRILSKQEKLVSLELDHCTITDFPDSPEIWALKKLKKLSLKSLKFPTPKDFENFTKFIKSLNKLTELRLKQLEDEESYYIDESEDEDDSDADDNRNDVTEILTHLLFLPTLTKLSFNYFKSNQTKKILNLNMQSPSVEDLTMLRINVDDSRHTQYMKVFPNVRKATVSYVADGLMEEGAIYYDPHANLRPLNSWTLLEELELRDFKNRMLYQIDVKTLHGLKIDFDWGTQWASWSHFCSKHPQLERLEVRGYKFENLLAVVEDLPNLKSLIINTIGRRFVSEEEAIKMIAEKCAKLEYLEVELKEMKAETAVAILKEKLPGLRGCVKQNLNIIDL